MEVNKLQKDYSMTRPRKKEKSLDSHLHAYTGSSIYNFDNSILLDWYPQRVLSHVKKHQSLLELGLGHGFTTNKFSEKFEKHVVLDGSPAVIDNFKNTYPTCSAEIVETYFEDFSTTERFDVIVLGFILEHVNDPIKILKHYRNFLAPNGQLFVSVPNAEVLNRRLGNIAGLLSDIEELSEYDLLLGHKRYYTTNSLKKDIEQAGFEFMRLEGIYLKPFTTEQILSLKLDPKIIQALCIAGVNYPELSCGILAELTLKK